MKEDQIKIISFIRELEKLKVVYRQNGVIGGSRNENSAEHSWHTAILSLLLLENLEVDNLDLFKIVKMILIHDIIEIDAGDHFELLEGDKEKVKKDEARAARRIFSLLPDNQGRDYLGLWNEFEEGKTREAKYAKVMDALQPLINHLQTGSGNPLGIAKSQIVGIKKFMRDTSEELWELAVELIEKSTAKGLYLDQ